MLLNLDKTEACFFGSRQRLQRSSLPASITVSGTCIEACESLKTLGVILNSSFTCNDHIDGVIRAINCHMWTLRHRRRSLTRNVSNTFACSIVNSHLDYCNSILYGATERSREKSQRTQNKLVRAVSDAIRRDYHIVDLLRTLHWLHICSRTSLKVATMCLFQAHRSGLPNRLRDVLRPYRPSHTLRSWTCGC